MADVILGGNYGSRKWYGRSDVAGTKPFNSIAKTQPCYIEGDAGAAHVTSSESVYVAGFGITTSNKGCYIQTSITSHQDAWIDGFQSITSHENCYIRTPEPTTSSHSCYLAGWDIKTSAKSAYIFNAIPITGSKNCFFYGLGVARPSQPAFIQIETPTTSLKRCFIQIETPVTTTRLCMLIASNFVQSYNPCYIAGLIQVRVSQPAFVQIETPVTTSKLCFLVGEAITSSKNAFIASPWRQLCFLQIQTPMTTSKSCYIRGHIPISNQKNLYTKGHIAITSLKRCFVQILTPVQINHNCYIVTVEPRTLSKDAYIRGINQQTVNHSCYMFGHYVTAPSAIGLYIRVGEPSSSNHAAFIQIETPGYFQHNCFIRGVDAFPLQHQNCYIDCRIKITSSQNCFLQIQTPIASSHLCFLQIETQLTASKSAHIRCIGLLQETLNCYTKGGFILTSFKPCYIQLANPFVGPPQLCYIQNKLEITDSKLCFIYQTGQVQGAQPIYLNGTHVGEVDVTKRAYINGRAGGVQASSSKNSYINGSVRTITSNHAAYVVNYGLIAYWKMDDGAIDSGVVNVNDYSDVNNDGTTHNFPTWVGEPYSEDC